MAKAAKPSQMIEITEEFFEQVAKPVAKVAKDLANFDALYKQVKAKLSLGSNRKYNFGIS